MLPTGDAVSVYLDDKKLQPQQKEQKIKTDGTLQLTVQPMGGAVIVK